MTAADSRADPNLTKNGDGWAFRKLHLSPVNGADYFVRLFGWLSSLNVLLEQMEEH